MAIQEYICTVTDYKDITPTVFQLSFKAPQKIEFQGGQFVSIVVPGAAGGRDLRRAYSIASNPEKEQIELCVKLVENGPGTNYLKSLKPGDKLKLFSTYGTFVYKSKPERDVIFISTGTGIAPFRSMLFSKQFNDAHPKSITLLLGVREDDEILYDEEFSKLSKLKWVKAVSRPSSNWNGLKGRVTDYFKNDSSPIDYPNTDFYLCGNGAMIDEMKKILAEKGVEKTAIHQEIYYKPKPGEAS